MNKIIRYTIAVLLLPVYVVVCHIQVLEMSVSSEFIDTLK